MLDFLSGIDWNLVLTYTLKIIGTALGTVFITLGSILFAKLKQKIGEARLQLFIDRCVKAAEQLFPNLGQKTGQQKYEYVLNLVKEKYPKLSNDYLKALIEGAVFSVSEEVKQIAKAQEEVITTSSLKVS